MHRQPANGGSVSAPQEQGGGGGSEFASFTLTAGQTPGNDSIGLRVTDGTNTTDVDLLIEVIAAVNNAPICSAGLSGPMGQGGRYEVEVGEQTSGFVSCTDDENDDLSYSILRQPANGGSVSAPQEQGGPFGQGASFTHTAGQTLGDDDFALQVTDGTHTVNVTVLIKVVAQANNAPSCFASLSAAFGQNGRYQVEAGDQTPGSISCTDDENDNLSFSLLRQPANGGSVSAPQERAGGGGNQFATFTHTAGQTLGDDDFAVRITDGTHTVDVEVRITVVAQANNAPSCFGGLTSAIPGRRALPGRGGRAEPGRGLVHRRRERRSQLHAAAPAGEWRLGERSAGAAQWRQQPVRDLHPHRGPDAG